MKDCSFPKSILLLAIMGMTINQALEPKAWRKDLASIRADFPILARKVGKRPLVYFDNAATTQKPDIVIDRLRQFYREENANIHRGLHYLSETATSFYEGSRQTVSQFMGAAHPEEIIFTRNATEAINLVAHSYLRNRIQPRSEIVLSVMEHHANIVPWQILEKETGLIIKVIPVTPEGALDLDDLENLLTEKTILLALCHVSNTLGTINPVASLVEKARSLGIPTLLDGAQAVAHFPVDVQSLGCDFYVFSGHKLFGPTGIGVLYGRKELLEEMSPYQGGGDMIEKVSFSGTTFAPPPARFEAGTPHISGAIGLAAAIEYLQSVDVCWMHQQEMKLLQQATEGLLSIPGVHLLGTVPTKVAVISFVVEGAHPHDLATFLDKEGIAVRAGHHCTMPLLEFYGIQSTTRASFAFYNTEEEVDHFLKSLQRSIELLR